MRKLIAGSAVLAALAVAGLAAAATVVVTPTSSAGWTPQHAACSGTTTGTQAFVNGPGTPPGGTGSYQFTIGTNGDSFETLRQGAFGGTKLSSLTALEYSTYVSQFGSGGQAPYLNLLIDNDGTGTVDDQLFFEPVYQNGSYGVPNQGNLTLNTWQTWNALAGGWWTLSSGTFGPPLQTLQQYVAAHPDATIVNTSSGGGFRIATGCGSAAWANFVGNVDKLTVGVSGSSTTYDFELTAPAGGGKGKSPAQACKAERKALGDQAFKDKYGTNHNKSNAFGKCVSKHAKKHGK